MIDCGCKIINMFQAIRGINVIVKYILLNIILNFDYKYLLCHILFSYQM